jgi:hypothetical protein
VTDKDELYKIVDFILNKADDSDLAVVKEALKRVETNRRKGPGGININKLAHLTGDAVSKQISFSKEQIHNTVAGFVKQMIKQQAPEITDKEIDVLMKEWIPSDLSGKNSGNISKDNQSKHLPQDIELKMIDQFLRFNNNQMSIEEQAQLRDRKSVV